MRIAIVGSGVAGLTAAHLLHARHEITLFEADGRLGGHTNTVRVDEQNATHWVDTGFIVYNELNYPLFERLLERLGVATQRSWMGFSVADEQGRFEFAGTPRGLFARPAHALDPRFLRMISDFTRFNRRARAVLADGDDDLSLAHWLEREGYSRHFVERLLVPQASAVWSADPGQMSSFPARFLVRFFDNHGMLALMGRPRWRTITGGAQRYVERITAPFADRVRTRAPVVRVQRLREHVELTVAGGAPQPFDHVVVATHADQALALLADATAAERDVLGAIRYQPNEAVLHTDTTLLPRRRAAWASWNYHLLSDPPPATTVTYRMNALQSLDARREYCVTLNRSDRIAPDSVLRVIPYSHPVFTPAAVRAQERWAQISGVERVHFCGAYWRWGFHEDGVWSADRVCRTAFGSGL